MRSLILACGLVIAAASWADAGYLVEGAFAGAARSSSNYNTPPGAPGQDGPTYALITSGDLPTYTDKRGAGQFGDAALKFSLASALAPGDVIVSAILSINVSVSMPTMGGLSPSLSVAGFAADANRVALADFDRTWMQIGVQAVGGAVGSNLAGPANPVSFDVTSFLQGLQAAGSVAAGFQFDNLTNGFILISSPGDPQGFNQPSLAITYAASVPEPASAALAAAGLAIALAASRRRAGAG